MQTKKSIGAGSGASFGLPLRHIARWAMAAALTATLCACGGGTSAVGTTGSGSNNAGSNNSGSTNTGSTSTTSSFTSVTASITATGGTLTLGGASLQIPANALVTPVTVSIGTGDTSAPSSAAGTTATSVIFTLLPHGTTFAQSVTLTVPFDPSALPSGVVPRLYKAEVGGGFTEIPSTVVGTTLVAYISNFSWAQSGYTLKPQAPIVQVEPDFQAARVSWVGVPGESYQVCQDATPSAIAAGSSFYPTQCTSASPPFTTNGLTNGTGYSFGVIATNSAGSATSVYVNGTPKALGRTWTQPATGAYDPYGCNASYTTETNSCGYKDTAYLRGKDGQDYFVSVKSTRQWMRIAGNADPEHLTNLNAALFNVQSVAGGNGYFVAVGQSGTIGVSGDYGRSWNFIQYTATGLNGDITYNAVAYVPDSLNRPGRFIAVGNWNDSLGPHDLVTTIDPAASYPCIGICGSSASAYVVHQQYSEYSALAAVSNDGLIEGGTSSGSYWDYSSGSVAFIGGGFSIKATGNLAAGTSALHTLVRTTLSATNALPFSNGFAAKVFRVNGRSWALTGYTGGQTSADGINWQGNYFQVINPYTQLGGIAAGPGQLVAVTYIGDTLYNTTMGAAQTSWTTISSGTSGLNSESHSYRKVVYGAGRYVVTGSQVFISN